MSSDDESPSEQAESQAATAPYDEGATAERRFYVLSAFCVVVIALAALLTSRAGIGFADPGLATLQSGNVEVGIQTAAPSSSAAEGTALPFETDVTTFTEADFNEDGFVYYQVYFPRKFVGHNFALMLAGDARLGKPKGEYDPLTRVKNTRCPSNGPVPGPPCQVLYGVITDQTSFPLSGPCAEGRQTPIDLTGDVPIEVSGSSEIQTSDSWAYHTLDFPALNSDSRPNASINQWMGVGLDGWWGTTTQLACRLGLMSDGWAIADQSSQPTRAVGTTQIWQGGDAYLAASYLMKNRDAETEGNELLAGAAASAALGIGFIPVAYDVFREWRRYRRKHPVAKTTPA